MKKLALACVAALTMTLTSCGFHNEATSNINQHQTSVVLSKNNYRVLKTVSGESQQTYIFGIGGLSKKSLTQSAHNEMIKNADLKGSQAIINTTVQYKVSTILGIKSDVTAIVTGTVIEFTE